MTAIPRLNVGIILFFAFLFICGVAVVVALLRDSTSAAALAIGFGFLVLGLFLFQHVGFSKGSFTILGQSATFEKHEAPVASPVEMPTQAAPREESSNPTSEAPKPDLVAFVSLGEFFWFLENPLVWHVDSVQKGISAFLDQLQRCGLTTTHSAAKALIGMQLEYNLVSNQLTSATIDKLRHTMAAIRNTMKEEIKTLQN